MSFMLLLIILSISFNILASEARPLGDILKVQGSGGAFDWLSVGSVHKFNTQIYLGIKNSGPSPGEGHGVTTTSNHQ